MPGRPSRSAPLPDWVNPALRTALVSRGIDSLYSHQREAIQSLRDGSDVVVATPTASGKTLCYNLPVFDALLEDPAARALYLFPTKALARDQMESARRLAEAIASSDAAPHGAKAPDLGVAVYDGDTPPDQRRVARKRARIIATNPDMLHAGILPHHTNWGQFLSGLRYVVIDELHTYRGVFGSHVANVLRRLQRLAQFHGSRITFIATSATIANPRELAAQLFGRDERETTTRIQVIENSGAPAGERHFAVYNPPVIDPALGLRESYLKAACKLGAHLAESGLSTLVFCRSRLAVEVAVRYLRDMLEVPPRGDLTVPGPASVNTIRVRGYRGGYLPDRRRDVEQAMRDGEPDIVVSTSALELGIDIGALDAVVIAGWPGSRAGTWQRAGRAGRRLAPSLTVLVASSEPADQFVANDPEYLFGQAVEHARVDPENTSILVPHLKCSAYELPFQPGDRYGTLKTEETADVLKLLAEAELLHQSGGRFHYIDSQYPAREVSLRGELDENFLVIDGHTRKVIAEVDYRDVPETLHQHAIYQLEGSQYLVEQLDHDAHRAIVEPVEVDYYTTARTNLKLRVLEQLQSEGPISHGEVHVVVRVVGFKKIKLHTHENLGYGDVSEPEREMHTSAFWLTPPADVFSTLQCTAAELAEATIAAAFLLHGVAALILMSDRADLGRAVGEASDGWFVASERLSDRGRFAGAPGRAVSTTPGREGFRSDCPSIFVYDRYPGGTGLAARLFDERRALVAMAVRRVEGCDCEAGCPACVGPGSTKAAKQRVARLLKLSLAADTVS
jgi:DEAD/DEAH box helicase domain-containing protein